MNLPNRLTLLRILCVPIFVILLVYDHYGWALALFLLAGVTDALDGLIARIWDQRTRLGTYLDPLADKLLLTAAFGTLAVLHLIPTWSAIVVVSRDLILMLGTAMLFMLHGRVEIVPSWLGKGATVAQLGYVLAVQAELAFDRGLPLSDPLLPIATALTVLSGLHYLYRGVRLIGADAGP